MQSIRVEALDAPSEVSRVDRRSVARRSEALSNRIAAGLRLALQLTLLIVLLAACSTPNADPPPVTHSGLYLTAASGQTQGLYAVNMQTGAATLITTAGCATSAAGLAPGPGLGQLFGADELEIILINADGSGSSSIGGTFGFTEALAFDPVNNEIWSRDLGLRLRRHRARNPQAGAERRVPPHRFDGQAAHRRGGPRAVHPLREPHHPGARQSGPDSSLLLCRLRCRPAPRQRREKSARPARARLLPVGSGDRTSRSGPIT